MKQHIRMFLLTLMAILGVGTASAQTYNLTAGDKITTDDGIYVVTGQNLVSNPTFDDGFTGWYGANGSELSSTYFDVPTSGGADDGAYLKALSGAGSSSGASVRQAWPIESGKKYVLHFWAYRPSLDGNAQYSQIHLGTSSTDTNHQIASVNYAAGAWNLTQVVFDASTYSYVIAKFSWLTNGAGFDCFNLYEIEASDELVFTNLENEIANAQTLLESTEEGTERGQYTTEVRQALSDAIAVAQGILTSATKQTEITDAVTALKAAESTYKNSVNPPFTVGKQYNIVHSSGYYLTTNGDGGTVKMTEADVSDKNQIFTFEPVPEGAKSSGYNLKDANGVYIYRSGSWDTKSSSTADLTAANTIFQVVDYGTYVQLKNMGSGSVLGTDGNSNNSTVYSNKNGTGEKNRWTLVEYVPADQRDAEYNFNELLGKAQKQYAEVDEDKVGNGLFQYNKSAYEAFGKAIEESQTMTDFQAALDYLQAAMDAFAANSINNPDPDAEYIITQSSGNPLGYDETQSLAVLGEQAEPFHIIAATGGAFYLQHIASGKYLAKSGSSTWDTSWEDTQGSATAQWIIAQYDDTYFTLQNNSGKGYLGSDNTTVSAWLYCDKSASAVNSHWTIVENSVSGVVDPTLQTAKDLLAEAEVGTEYWQVPQSAYDALQSAIEKAEADKATATMESASTIVEALQEAMTTFKNSYNPVPAFDPDLTYYAVHSGGNVLTATASGNATITAIEEPNKPTENQRIAFETTDGGITYLIRSISLGTYLACSGDYNTAWVETADETCKFEIVHTQGHYLGLKNYSKGTYFGTDASTAGQAVYSDKSAVLNSCWMIQTYQDLDRTLFNAALEKAQTFAASMKEGYQVGEYFADVITEYAQVIAQAQTASKKATSQEELDQMAKDLEATIATYQAKANATNRAADYLANLVAECQTEANAAVIGVEQGQYQQSVVEAFRAAIQAAQKSSDAELAIVALNQAREEFRNGVNSVNRSTLSSTIAAAQKTAATLVAGDCNGQYPQDAIDAYNHAIQDAQTVYNNIAATQSDVDAANAALKTAADDLADAKVVIDFSGLKQDITDAEKMVTDCASLIGEGPGTYPQEAYDALKQAIETAKGYVGSSTANQKAINEASDALQQAIATFEETWRDIDKSELQALIDAMYALRSAGVTLSDDDQEILDYDIELGESALKSTEQAVIDRATKILTRDYAYLNEIVTAIHSILAGENVANAQIYDLSGRRISRLQRGINIIRMNEKSYKVRY